MTGDTDRPEKERHCSMDWDMEELGVEIEIGEGQQHW
jgi:hypothetical protein